MMNRSKQLKAGALALLAGLYSATAFSASINGVANATILEPVTLTPGAAMSFGTIAAGSNATTVSVDSAGNVTAPAGAGNAVVTVAAGAALTFDIQAANGVGYTVSIADGVLDTVGGSGATMTVSNFAHSASGTGTGAAETVTVTADLAVGANQPAGSYSTANDTAIVITADYQ